MTVADLIFKVSDSWLQCYIESSSAVLWTCSNGRATMKASLTGDYCSVHKPTPVLMLVFRWSTHQLVAKLLYASCMCFYRCLRSVDRPAAVNAEPWAQKACKEHATESSMCHSSYTMICTDKLDSWRSCCQTPSTISVLCCMQAGTWVQGTPCTRALLGSEQRER